MQRNAQRLQRLVEQLLDLSRIESHRMPLHARQDDIVPKIREWVASFVSLAESKNIALNLHFPAQPVLAYFDAEKLEKIVYNLLSNAFKFTPEGGVISVQLSVNSNQSPQASGQLSVFNNQLSVNQLNTENCLLVTVKDTSIGIPSEHLPHIFDRFYRASEVLPEEQSGTGNKLALTKEFVELHHGEIRVGSEVGKGSAFTILVPLGREHLSDDEIVEPVFSDQYPVVSNQFSVICESLETSDQSERSGDPDFSKPPATNSQQPRLLIVGDNDDMRRYQCNSLNKDFGIIEAENGASGYQTAIEKAPDLIVSDVMMPGMDGFELCRKLKTDARTSHIPVILLTARARQEDKLEGLEIGADDYLTKPLDARELQIRAKNLIVQRRQLQERFRRDLIIKPAEVTATSMDEAFLGKAIAAVEAHIDEPDFETDGLAKESGIRCRQRNRKLRALTGQSVREFIRTLRLKRAAQLLQQQSGTVTEIAYAVGFNNLSHFAKIFRELFGVAPSEFSGNTSGGG